MRQKHVYERKTYLTLAQDRLITDFCDAQGMSIAELLRISAIAHVTMATGGKPSCADGGECIAPRMVQRLHVTPSNATS